MRHAMLPLMFLLTPTLIAGPNDYTDPELTPADRQHWSFVAPKRSPIPPVKQKDWVRTPIDAFILAKQEAKDWKPAPEADRLTLIRRVTIDLTGLPPTPAEVDAFLADKSPTAYEKVVDRLLASPSFGERWAQHWLDVVRYAESNGYEADGERPNAWRYRDYVIKAFNSDKPYDQFVTEQVAGDYLAKDKDPKTVSELWIATGMHRCGQSHVVGGNLDPAITRQENLTEMVNGVGSTFLGLTIGCARCHDHKFDPLSLGDYYRLEAFFAGSFGRDIDLATDAEKMQFQQKLVSVTARTAPIKNQIVAIEAPYRAKLIEQKKAALPPAIREAMAIDPKKRSPEQKKLADSAGPLIKVMWDEVLDALEPKDRAIRDRLKQQQIEIERELPSVPAQAWAVADDKSTPPTHVLRRGDLKRKATVVSPSYPRLLAGESPSPKNRLDLARWLTKPDNPLTARVIVNRLWQHHFGQGLVNTPNDFGTRGDRPSHPELLDWLARELVEPTAGPGAPWTMKRIHRLMVTSATYRQASQTPRSPEQIQVDPTNRLLVSMNRQRAEAEVIRDSMLLVSGKLKSTVGGPSVKIPLEPEVYDLIFTEDEPAGLWKVTADVTEHSRRSLYLFLKRNVRQPLLETFDQPDTLNSCAARGVSTFAPQALILMNGPIAREQSQAMALSVLKSGESSLSGQVKQVYRRAYGRAPTAQEEAAAVEFLKWQAELVRPRSIAFSTVGIPPIPADPATVTALADLCLAIFNTNEFVTRP